MKRELLAVLCLLVLIPTVSWSEEVVITTEPVFFSGDDSLLMASKGGLFVTAKVSPEASRNDLLVIKIDTKGKVVQSVKVDTNGLKPLYTRLIEVADRLLLFCHVKADDGAKFLYLFQSADGGKSFQRTAILNTKRDVLNPFTVAHSDKNIYAVWIDERKPKEFALYMNYSHDGGMNFQKEDINLTEGFNSASLPNILAHGEAVFLFFKGTGTDKPVGLYFRRSLDGGKKWSEPVLVTAFEASWQPTAFRATRLKDGTLAVAWYGIGIYMATSKDGKDWSIHKVLDAGDGSHYVFNADLAQDESGSMVVVADYGLIEYAYERRPRPSVYSLRSTDGGVTWSKPEGLRQYPYTSTSAFAPKIAFSSDKKTAVVVWQDHRYIRGATYANVSLDGGKSWVADPVALEVEPGRYHSFSPQIVSMGDDFYALWYRARDDSRQRFDLALKKISKEDLLKGVGK